MTTQHLLSKNPRTMPKWVNETHDRIGPKPPPPPINGNTATNGAMPKAPALPPKIKNQPEPDYEVIEFSGQQYSNEPLKANVQRIKTPENKLKCTLCGSNNPWVTCAECSGQIFCASCDDMFHKHPKRKSHVRKAVELGTPPIPPKIGPGQPGPTPPVAPPRRSKRGLLTPFLSRKEQINPVLISPPSPTPSQKHNGNSGGWQERMGSLKRGMGLSMNNRPLPETPKTPQTPSEGGNSSRSTTPKSVFDNIQRPPSVQLEKIKSKASATLDRMAILQQRYRQQKEERERSGSITEQRLPAFDHWSNISPSPSHFRSGSMSSGLNSSHFDLTDDSTHHFNAMLFQRQQAQHQPKNGGLGGNRSMSTSVFNLNAPQRRPMAEMSNGWMQAQRMQQAQSMAQLNCASCSNHPGKAWPQQQHHLNHQQQHGMHPDEWSQQFGSQQQFNHSNLSLNVGPGYMVQHQQHPPPVFMTQHGMMPAGMYPYNYAGGMPVMQPGLMGMPPSAAASRAASRVGSRFASPTPSRKSVTMRRKRSNYVDDELTDDEDSDQDDRRSMVSNRSAMTSASRTLHSQHHHHHHHQQHQQHQPPRQRRLSSASQLLNDDDSELNHSRARHKMRDRRGSVAKSVQSEWLPERRDSATNMTRNESGFSTPAKSNRIYSDLDSEGSGTRALVQAKIQQKLEEERAKQKQAQKAKRKPQVEKKSTEVQAGHVVQAVKPQVVEAKPIEVFESEVEEEEVVASEPGESEEEEEEVEEEGEEEEETEEVLEKEVKNVQSPFLAPVTNGVEIDESAENLGPPPSTPDYEWECEFCTFVNEPNIKICSICCKTPSKPPVNRSLKQSNSVQETVKVKEQSKPSIEKPKIAEKPKIVEEMKTQSRITKVKQETKRTNSSSSTSTEPRKPTSTKESTTSATPSTKTNTSTNQKPQKPITAPKSKLKHSTSECESDNSSLAKGFAIKESVENIWTTLDESIQAQADQVLKKAQKVSTACGSSPVREVGAESAVHATEMKNAREMGTSPPPQSISTQTYDTLPFRREDAIEPIIKPNLDNAHYKTPEPAIMEPPNPYYRSQSQLSQENERYRSSNDLRFPETYTSDYHHNNVINRRPSLIHDLKSLQNFQQASPFGLPVDTLSYEHRAARDPETELHIILKELELYKFTVEELQAALKYCGADVHPIQWLRENWHKLVQTVQSLATKYGQERAENTIGSISQNEAREALRLSSGNVWQAVSECIEQRQRKFRELHTKGNFLREDIVNALTAHQGNVEHALLELNRTQLKPFLMRIWGSPGGVENESVAGQASPFAAEPSPTQIKSDIHDFLNTHALDCLQTPNSTGINAYNAAHLTPFDTFDTRSNIMAATHLDNPSPKSAYNTPSPFQLEDGTLKNLELLIGNIEQNQAKQNQEVLRSIESMLENFKGRNESEFDTDPEIMRIMTKSPIMSMRTQAKSSEEPTKSTEDVKNFVWQHIQEIVPNLVQQVELELLERPDDTASAVESNLTTEITVVPEKGLEPEPEPMPISQETFIFEEVIKPNLREASIREELPPTYVYATEIANFQLEFDRGASLEHEADWDPYIWDDVERITFKSFIAEIPEPPNIVETRELPQTYDTLNKSEEQHAKTQAASVEISEENISQQETDIVQPKIINLNESENIQRQTKNVTRKESKLEIENGVSNAEDSTNENTSNVSIATESQQVVLPNVLPLNEAKPLEELPSTSKAARRRNRRSQLPRNTQRQDGRSKHNREAQIIMKNEKRNEKESKEKTQNFTEEETDNSPIDISETDATELPIIRHSEVVNTVIVEDMSPRINNTESNESNVIPEQLQEQSLGNFSESSPKPTRVSRIPVRTLSTNSIRSESRTSTHTPTLMPDEINLDQKNESNVKENVTENSSQEDNSNALEQASEDDDITNHINTEDAASNEQLIADALNNQNNPEVAASSEPLLLDINNDHNIQEDDNNNLKQENQEDNVENQNNQEDIVSNNPLPVDVLIESQSNATESEVEKSNRKEDAQLEQQDQNGQNIQEFITETALIETPSIEISITENSLNTITELPMNAVDTDELFQDATEFSDKEVDDEDEEEEANESITEQDDITSDGELYSVASDASSRTANEIDLRIDMLSPNSTSEVLLLINNDEELPVNEIRGSASNTTISSHSSQETTNKSLYKDFVPSGDPAKQNLSELVEDTQRLIKQMREEISMDEFESSDDDYTDEDPYSDEYDEEGWYDEEGEGEESGDEALTYENQTMTIEEESSGAEEEAYDNINEEIPSTEIASSINESEALVVIDQETTINHTPHSTLDQSLDIQESVIESFSSTEAEPQVKQEPVKEEVTTTNVSSHEINNDDALETENVVQFPTEVEVDTEIIPRPIQFEDTVADDDLPEAPEETSILPIDESISVDEIESVPIVLPPIIEGSESRPIELPAETVLQQPLTNIPKISTENLNQMNDNDDDRPSTSKASKSSSLVQPDSSTSNSKPASKAKSNVSKIPKPTESTKTTTNLKKITTRSKSFSGPPTPIGISSVKALQQNFIQKQNQLSSSIKTPNGKINAPVGRKKSITEAINKLTKPSTSKIAQNGTGTLFRSRTQPRIPKKKYHETCFSDDYQSTTEEEQDPEPIELRTRKLSMPVFRAYPSVQEIVQEVKIEDPEVLARKFVEQELVSNIGEAQIAATLVNMKFQQDVALWAAKECSDLDQAISMLQQDCELCMSSYPMNQIVSMLKCTHKCCKQCAKSYFTVQITDRSINDCSCPFCKLPELSNIHEHEDEHLEYFSNLDIFLKNILDNDVHELFQRKLRDRSLLQDPNFKWCIQCSSGFFARPKQKRLICPDCGSVTCALCRKPWERQHEGTSCEVYLEWKRENDPEVQAQGVQEHLARNGIDCPKCKFRYSLARGGCMHFTCTQCKFEFCCGCARTFMMGAKCNVSPYCAKLGLHAHHPRNCLFYLRDKIPLQLQFLLKENGVKFEVDPIELTDELSTSKAARASARCPIPLQKETPQGLVDTICNSDVPDNHAGMCRTHYVEYLSAKVAKAGIDPLPIFDLTDCVQELRRRGIALPERGPWDTDEIYKNMCSEVIKKNIPLKSA